MANKIDLDERRVISPKAGIEFAESNQLKYFECSAVSTFVCDIYHYLLKIQGRQPLYPNTLRTKVRVQ